MILDQHAHEVQVVRVATRDDSIAHGLRLSYRDLQSGRWLVCRRISDRAMGSVQTIEDRYTLTADSGQREIKEALRQSKS